MLLAPHALLPQGWARDVLLAWDSTGRLTAVTPEAAGLPDVQRADGPVIPGMPNLHSHAFQRAFAGLTEYRGEGGDSFWSWRERMYRFAAAITPEQLEEIATHLYIEMLRAGYTSVCEFHYLHHDQRGAAYADPAEMGLRIVAAARRAGIGLTLLPVLYQASGFGAQPSLPSQRRFVNDVDALLRIVEGLRSTEARVGVAPHSLRAVPAPALEEVVAGLHALDAGAPLHVHIAEQQREVDDCVAWSGQRPVQWLMAHAPVDARWCLVHATHADADERRAMARSGAVVGLCPTTEANLGDGVFDAADLSQHGGAWGIGSDSHASVDAAEELRWLEYLQRLAAQRRNVLATAERPQAADQLWLAAVAGGAQASARPVAGLRSGQRADFVVLSPEEGLDPAFTLASHVFARGRRDTIAEVWVGGRCRIARGRHEAGDEARRRFVDARGRLLREA
ncbi:formimidoylglutamate deiminase [Piscinibacter sp. XHJ-5]|uniref:formimidoylglutamate deiminase n=1 Tax=Piscinibacter sp. XHJ-5 TaxID=3037797 RepID=UPI0024529938|nr:formimidoylglutamate deiminase [Piscinibacter sp. XHJ-5]